MSEISHDERTNLMTQAKLAEYSSLRSESLAAIGHRITIVGFTFAAIGAMLGGFLSSRLPDLTIGLLSFVSIPLLARCAQFIWIGEYKRSQRAGGRIREIEGEIDDLLADERIMFWERRLSKEETAKEKSQAAGFHKLHMTSPYMATMALLIFLGVGGEVVGIGYLARYFAVGEHVVVGRLDEWVVWLVGMVIAGMFELFVVRGLRREWRHARDNSR
jgi:hypothetical protein